MCSLHMFFFLANDETSQKKVGLGVSIVVSQEFMDIAIVFYLPVPVKAIRICVIRTPYNQ